MARTPPPLSVCYTSCFAYSFTCTAALSAVSDCTLNSTTLVQGGFNQGVCAGGIYDFMN